MIYHTIQQDIDLWEAWVEFDPLSSHHFGTLYVMGEVVVDKKQSHPFIIKCFEEKEPHTLVLKVQVPAAAHANHAAEVVYTEPLKSINQYASIKIFMDNELLAEIKEVEVLI